MIDDILSIFTNFKNILCVCPECNNISRLSQLYLYSAKKTAKTWLDDYEDRVRSFREIESEHDSKANEIREQAIQRGRDQVPNLVNTSLSETITKLKYDPYDIKPINHPIDYVVYDGMNNNSINNVVFLHEKNMHLTKLHQSIADTVKINNMIGKYLEFQKKGCWKWKTRIFQSSCSYDKLF